MQLVDSALAGMAQQKRGESICTFSQQLNNPHALWIDRLPREFEKGRDGEKGSKRGRACCALWYCGGFCVCVGSAASFLGPGQGPHSARVCVAKLSGEGGSFLVGTRRPESAGINKFLRI